MAESGLAPLAPVPEPRRRLPEDARAAGYPPRCRGARGAASLAVCRRAKASPPPRPESPLGPRAAAARGLAPLARVPEPRCRLPEAPRAAGGPSRERSCQNKRKK